MAQQDSVRIEAITQEGRSERPSDRSRRVAEARAKFRAIRLPYPRQDELVAALDELRLTGQLSKGQTQGGVRLIADTGSGKTVGAERFKAYVEAAGEHTPGSQPVVIATVDGSGTTRSIPASILKAMGVPRPEHGAEPVLWMRAFDALERHETQLLIIDEFNRAARRPTMSSAIATALRDVMDRGIVPMAFLATEEARDVFRRSPDLAGRLDAPVTMDPLDWLVEEDRDLFESFVSGLDDQLVELRILRTSSGFAIPKTAQTLCEASNGNIRQLCRIIETALAAVVRRDDPAIGIDDLADAVEDWSIANHCISYNPFREK
ncbi:TniB family NTP-binding protein [Sphingomonas sp. LHG3443-2]|uniref:TniB family NTP-binding protein n=1 Tax=Sphingomonas sp. LHG3443-2 TaxID=2804639 RepID=UPI003CF4E8CB